jgi:hypothetical protein
MNKHSESFYSRELNKRILYRMPLFITNLILKDKSETKLEDKSETKLEDKSETKLEDKSETKLEDKSETKLEDDKKTKSKIKGSNDINELEIKPITYNLITSDENIRLHFMFIVHKLTADGTVILRDMFKTRSINNIKIKLKPLIEAPVFDEMERFRLPFTISKVLQFHFESFTDDELLVEAKKLFSSATTGEIIAIKEHNTKKDVYKFVHMLYKFLEIKKHFHPLDRIIDVLKEANFVYKTIRHDDYNKQANPTYIYYLIIEKT